MARKGANLIFEQVLLFMIGITIFLICFSIFQTYERFYTESIALEQMGRVSILVTSSIITISQDSDSELLMTVPGTIANEPYIIDLKQEGLNISSILSRRSVFSPLSGINETFILSGRHSTSGERDQFRIYKSGNQIIIG